MFGKVRKFLFTLTAIVLFAGTMTGGAAPSHALLILDNMIFIGPKSGAATFKIKNTADAPEAYRLDWTQLRMKPTGGKDKVAPGEVIPNVMAAEPYMFMAPRRLMLMPDQLQHVRFMVRRNENLAPGEYRSYIVFQPELIPQQYNPATGAMDNTSEGKAAAQITMLSGYRIPVFFLHGDTTLEVSVTGASYGANRNGKNGFNLTFNRKGNRSALGNLTINCATGDQQTVLASGDIRIFTELESRNFFFLSNPVPPGCTMATVDYVPHSLDPDYTGNPVRLAEIPL